MKCIELFSGAGGLALGLDKAGFEHSAVVEWNKDACETIRTNQKRGFTAVKNWPLHEMDVRQFDYAPLADRVELVAGGPPCQPFSLGGKHRAYLDERDMFPEAVRALREVRPKAFLFENVRGLTRPTFAKYFEYIILQFTYPDLIPKKREKWLDHLSRLEKYHTQGKVSGLNYRVVFRVLNASDFGIPQRRERVIMVGFRSDLGVQWSFPEPTHSHQALMYDQWITGDYWERHEITKRRRPPTPPEFIKRLEYWQKKFEPLNTKPWLTVRDAIGDLPDPTRKNSPPDILNHHFMPGAKVYPGHTGSPLDLPAKTLKAGDHGVPGGENMLVLPDGKVRYFTVRESARLQTFPDEYALEGSWSEAMRQIGNAVPVNLGEVVATSVLKHLKNK
ncbi:MAG TPA: DNA cytosine methyltransferase [Fibrobacteria bacterium]|nr:DNA cytosine methyltransferase [Fibrobacteria bacterium]